MRWVAAAAVATVFAAAGGASAYADNVENDVTASTDTVTLAVGGTATIGFRIIGNSAQQDPDPDCNFDGALEFLDARLSASIAGIASASPSILHFTKCSEGANTNSVYTTVTGLAPGTTHFTMADSVNSTGGGKFSYGNAAFTVVVTAPAQAATTTTVTCPASVTYDGSAQEVCSATTTSGGATIATPTVTYTDNTDAGTATATATYAGDATHQASSDSKTFTITKASSTTTVTCPTEPVTYTGAAQEPCTARATGAGGLDEALPVSYAGNVHAGTADASASYAGDANHGPSEGSAQFSIGQASSTTTITCDAGPFTFDGTNHDPCTARATGDGGLDVDIPVSYDPDDVHAGTVSVSATFAGDADHTGSSDSAAFEIGQATATCSVSGYTGTYDGDPHGLTGTCTGVGGVDLSAGLTLGETHTDAGTHTVAWSFEGGNDYADQSGEAVVTIDRANPYCLVTPDSGPYTAQPRGANGTCIGVKGEVLDGLEITGTFVHVPGGTVHWSIPASDNYNAASGDVDLVITPIDATCTVAGWSGVFDGAAHGASGDCTGIGDESPGTLSLGQSYTDVPGGTATWTLTGNDDYNDEGGDVEIAIAKATSTVEVTCPDGPYYFTGSPITPACTARATGVGGLDVPVLPVTFTDNTAVGTATASASYAGDLNHERSTGSTTFTILGWTTTGFYQPVDMGKVNTVKGGSTVPLKFEVFAGSTELTATSVVKSFVQTKITCDTSAAVDEIEVTSTGGTSLRYDTTGGQFIQNWQTPKSAGACYKVTMTAQDGSSLSALFKLK